MKSKKKTFGMLVAALLLVVGSVMGTMAYLTSQDAVENTFTVGNVKITLDEAKVNADGTLVADADRVQENEYKLLPGHTYTKDPIVHVDADSEKCWLFVKVENGLEDIEGTTTIASQMVTNGWTLVFGTTDVYAQTSPIVGGTDKVVFENFTIDGDVVNTELDDYKNAKIVVKAYAVQADGFADAAAAWAATFGAATE